MGSDNSTDQVEGTRGRSTMVVQPNEHVVFKRLGGQMVLVHLKTNAIFELNTTSARFWELLTEDGDISVVEARLAQEYDVEPAMLRREIAATLSVLATEKLITGYDAG